MKLTIKKYKDYASIVLETKPRIPKEMMILFIGLIFQVLHMF